MSLIKLPVVAIDGPAFQQASASGALVLTIEPQPELYWRISSSAAGCDIFVGHSNYHLMPEAFELCGGCLVGVNEWLFLLRPAGVAWRIHLAGLFFTVVRASADEVIVQHEIGFTRVACNGQVRSDVMTGILSSFNIDDDLLTFETLEGETGVVRL